MNLRIKTPHRSLKPSHRKDNIQRNEFEVFKTNLSKLSEQLKGAAETEQTEEHFKNLLTPFLKDTFYKDNYINTCSLKGNIEIDLAIYEGKNAKSKVNVLIEVKVPSRSSEMVTTTNLHRKSFYELILYYLWEKIIKENHEIKNLVITNIEDWFIFDATVFEKLFFQNTKLKKQFDKWHKGQTDNQSTEQMYSFIAEVVKASDKEVKLTHFNLNQYIKIIGSEDKKKEKRLTALFKLFSPRHLLKKETLSDSNQLNKHFYTELLHIIGLEETKVKGKKLITRKTKPDMASLLENTIIKIESRGVLHRLPNPSQYGTTKEERLFNVGLELCITWTNRILFLKLLESQVIGYHNGNRKYAFLNPDKIKEFDELETLFFEVLAKRPDQRSDYVNEKFPQIPYLNSSLFEPTSLETNAVFISGLKDNLEIPIYSKTAIRKDNKPIKGKLSTLEYLLRFLDAYDFGAEGVEDIQEESKTLINASVLGLIFEKINGYKEGSFYTPGYITMYMCKETIRRATVEKFNQHFGWKCTDLTELYNSLEPNQIKEANELMNSLTICDPAVGSGHFLVSALNEVLLIKSELGILTDSEGKRLKGYYFYIDNDELSVFDEEEELFEYHLSESGKIIPEKQRLQETLFKEKRTIIENCLFGVDINPNSVKICRLRLWIELLKNAFYTKESNYQELETLPNIDINIKCGNSLISRFDLDADLSKALKSIKYNINDYRGFVSEYKRTHDKEYKRGIQAIIDQIKTDFRSEIHSRDPKIKKLSKLNGELFNLSQGQLFGLTATQKKKQKAEREKLEKSINKLSTEIEEIKNNKIYQNAFEWRFEFPEVLDVNGDFVGFDVVIGNPPYIRQEELKEYKPQFKSIFSTYTGTTDIYVFFIEKAFSILKHYGQFSFIMPNKFMQAGYGRPARKYLLEYNLIEIIDFGDLQVFEGATTYPCILIAKKSIPNEEIVTIPVKTLTFQSGFDNYVENNKNKISQNSLSDETWIVTSVRDMELLDKIKLNSVPLKDFIKGAAKRGIVTGLSEAFIIDGEKKDDFNKKNHNEQLIKPLLQGRDLKPYLSIEPTKYLLFIPWHFPLHEDKSIKGASKNAELVFETKYPEVFNHLSLYKDKLKLRNKAETGIRYEWYAMQRYASDYYQEFEKPKIMYQVMQVKPCFIYDEKGLFCNNSIWFIPTNDKTLLGTLNSKMGWWLISKYCTQIQNGYQLIWKYFGQIPIANYQNKKSTPIAIMVNEILELKRNDPKAEIKPIEAQIDQLVYQLYDLTEEEIQIIEDSVK